MTNSYLMKWICDNGHQSWAYEFKCHCGALRTSGVKWFLPDPLVMATDEQEALKGKGPNWFCEYCDCENPEYHKTNCDSNCGAPIGKAKTTLSKIKYPSLSAIPRTAKDAVSFEVHEVDRGDAGWGMGPDEQEAQVGISRMSSAKPKVTLRSPQLPRQQSYVTTTANSKVKGFFETEIGKTGITYKVATIGIAILTVVALIIYAIWFNFYDTTTKSAWVSSLGWTNNTRVDQYMELKKTDWDENVPVDSYNKSCFYIVREYNHKVVDGSEVVDVQGLCDKEVPVACAPEGDGAGGVTIPTGCTDTIQVSCTKQETREKFHYENISDFSCSYNVMRWQTIDNIPRSGLITVIPESGNSHETPYDHGIYVETPNFIHLVEEPGTYTVNFSSEYVEPFSFDYDYNEWLQFDLHKNVSIEVNRRHKVPFRPTIEILQ